MESRVDATLRHNGLKNFDFAVFKRTTFGERAGLDFRTELFNLFNHPQFGFPGTNFVSGSSSGFGDDTAQQPSSDTVRLEIPSFDLCDSQIKG